FRMQAERSGVNRSEAASALGLPARTLRRWEWAYRHDHLQPRPLGRPVARSCVQRRNEVIRAIQEAGPGLGLPTLRGHFHDMARGELSDLLRRYRRAWRRRRRQALRVLHWQRAGSVWAIDYSQAPAAIDGCYDHLLAVRDLASAYTL